MKNLEEVLQIADNLIFDQTGEHLTEIQEAILLNGVWQREKYSDIAKKLHCSESHIRKEASELWKILGKDLGDDLNKFNFRSKLEKKYNISQVSTSGDWLQIDNINICGQFSQTINSQQRSPVNPNNQPIEFPIINLTEAPELNEFYDRTTELTTLKQWITAEHIHLITIYGLSGIGKSAITRQLIEEIKTEFDYIIWKSLDNRITFTNLENQLRQFIDPTLKERSPDPPQPNIIEYLRAYRCLIILDDLQNIFATGQLAGQYLPEYEDYSKFFQQVAKNCHQSCLILLSWEKPRENINLKAEKRSIQTMNLQGLAENATKAILQNKGLTDEHQLLELIALYQNHPTWLNIITTSIIKLFNGSVSLFLADEPTDIYLGNIETIIAKQYQRLSTSEIKVITWLANQNNPVDIAKRPTHIDLSKSEFCQAVESLMRRSILEKSELTGRSLFFLNPIWQQYIKNQD